MSILDRVTTPFVILHDRQPEAGGHFTPCAHLVLTAALRTSGLLAMLPDREARTLLAMLTFLTPNGEMQPTTDDLAAALKLPPRAAQECIQALITLRFGGKPIALIRHRQTASAVFTLAPNVISQVSLHPDPVPVDVRPTTGSRDAVVAASRATYGRPREEVERIVAQQLGHSALESQQTPEGEAYRALLAVGVTREEAERIVGSYSSSSILEQVAWLPDRGARQPDRFVVAAIEGDYEPPARIRLERAVAQESVIVAVSAAAEGIMAGENQGPPPQPYDLVPGEPLDLPSDDLPPLTDFEAVEAAFAARKEDW